MGSSCIGRPSVLDVERPVGQRPSAIRGSQAHADERGQRERPVGRRSEDDIVADRRARHPPADAPGPGRLLRPRRDRYVPFGETPRGPIAIDRVLMKPLTRGRLARIEAGSREGIMRRGMLAHGLIRSGVIQEGNRWDEDRSLPPVSY